MPYRNGGCVRRYNFQPKLADSVFAASGFSKPGEEICLTGDLRAHGAKETRSQGLGLYAFRCADMTNGKSGTIDALPILHHPHTVSYTHLTLPTKA